MMAPQAHLLSGDRLHLHHGPIDLIIGVEGSVRDACYQAAVERFDGILAELVEELPALRQPVTPHRQFHGSVARRMRRAVGPYGDVFVTPMAAVAGAVADEVLAAMVTAHQPTKAYVNNGGDIAFHLGKDAAFSALGPSGEITIRAENTIRGIATSGWRGRSHSCGIADAVTVLARSAAAADVAATLIANAVDLPGHPAVIRTPASDLNPDSDLGDRLVTADVAQLASSDTAQALANGRDFAERLVRDGLIHDAILSLQGAVQTVTAHKAIPLQGTQTHA